MDRIPPDGAAGHEPAAAVVGSDVDLGAEPLERDAGAEQHPRPVDGLVEVGVGLTPGGAGNLNMLATNSGLTSQPFSQERTDGDSAARAPAT